MAGGYTEIPRNMMEIVPYVITDKKSIVEEILESRKCFFYDTCSFRRHAKLERSEMEYLLKYIKMQNGIVIITRCILMELASYDGLLNGEYIEYLKIISRYGIDVLVMYEEDIFFVMNVCFSTNSSINAYLCWTVRTMKLPVSTITRTFEQNGRIHEEVIKGKNRDNGGVYKRFFGAVRSNKESGDSLGEELLAICLHILSYMPGEADGKFCVITDDKGAGSKIDTLFRRTAKQFKGKKIVIFSTPKLVQVLYREKIIADKEHIKAILSVGTEGNIVVLGTQIYDLINNDISLSADELAELIVQPNGINIVF